MGKTDIFQDLFYNVPIIMLVISRDARVENINYATSVATGKDQEQVMGLRGGELFGCVNSFIERGCGRTKECATCVVRNSVIHTLQTGESLSKIYGKLTVKTEEGFSLRHILVSTALIRYDNEPKVMLTIDDITEQKEAEEELLLSREALTEAKRIAEHANHSKSAFLATMSHELRTPLNSILGFSQFLNCEKKGKLNEKQKRYVRNIMTSGNHLLHLINNILDITKLDSGEVELNMETVDLGEIISDAEQMVLPMILGKGITLELDCERGDFLVRGDRVKIKQILYNLLGNAVKFTPPDGSVSLVCRRAGEWVKVSVSDTGVGISKEDLEQIFDPFVQVQDYHAREHGGVGLGLSIVRSLVEMHGGNIRVDSEPGKGSTFSFTIPADDF